MAEILREKFVRRKARKEKINEIKNGGEVLTGQEKTLRYEKH